jgi:DNA-directed RNA polymerase subunit RPC12/RpoP
MILNLFLKSGFFHILWLVCLILVYVRMFSKNTSARYSENLKYLEIRDKVTDSFRRFGISDFFRRISDFFRNLTGRWGGKSQSGDFHIYRCPKCGQKIRIPRGKGMIVITCPRCRTEFKKRS